MTAAEIMGDFHEALVELVADAIGSVRVVDGDGGYPLMSVADLAERKAIARAALTASGLDEAIDALEPFAKLGQLLDGPFAPALFRDEQTAGIGGAWSENGEAKFVTFGDLRRARDVHDKLRGQS